MVSPAIVSRKYQMALRDESLGGQISVINLAHTQDEARVHRNTDRERFTVIYITNLLLPFPSCSSSAPSHLLMLHVGF